MKVLIVDDEELVRLSLDRAFNIAGHEVQSAESGAEAISVWAEFKPEIVLLDVLMPEMNGPEVLKTVDVGTCKVILMSAYKGEYDSQTARGLGAHDFFVKPFENIMELVKKVEQIHG